MEIATWVNEHRLIIVFPLLLGFLLDHIFRWSPGYQPPAFFALLALLTFVAGMGIMALMFEPIHSVSIADVLLFIALYGVPLYIVLCEILLQGGAQWLTKKCGGKWVKGLDYVYLTFGVLGIIGSASKIEQIKDKFSGVIRFIKTRAEIGDWNKQPANEQSSWRPPPWDC
jgi:hypothetical protein